MHVISAIHLVNLIKFHLSYLIKLYNWDLIFKQYLLYHHSFVYFNSIPKKKTKKYSYVVQKIGNDI